MRVIIHRADHSGGHFTMTANSAARDKRLSVKARGTLWFILSHDGSREITPRFLVDELGESMYAIANVLGELAHYGYADHVRERDARGRLTWHWEFYEVAQGGGNPTTGMVTTPMVTTGLVNGETKLEEVLLLEDVNPDGTSYHRGEVEQPPLVVIPPKARDPDLLYLAVVGACGMDPGEMTSQAKRAAALACNELRVVGATPGEVAIRAENYRRHMPDAVLTPHALAKHWALCARPPNLVAKERHVGGLTGLRNAYLRNRNDGKEIGSGDD